MAGRDGIVDSTISSVQLKVSYTDYEGHLQPFSDQTTARIVDALANRRTRLTFNKGIKKESFSVDLKRLKYIELDCGKEYEIVIEIPSQQALEAIEIAFGRTQLLSIVLKDLCEVDFFTSIIDKAAFPNEIECVEMNHHIVSGGKLFTRFLDALEKKTNENPGLLDEVVDLLLKRRDFEEESGIEYVFHGTPPQNLSSICENGMDPSLRRHEGDYFGVNAYMSLFYCVKSELPLPKNYKWPEKLRLLVFLLLLPGYTNYIGGRNEFGYKVMNDVNHELPIATVDVKVVISESSGSESD